MLTRLMKNPVSLSQMNDLDYVSVAKCDQYVLDSFRRDMDEKLWPVDTLLLASAIMAGVIVGMGSYGQRYRHHRFTRVIFLGASTLFLPIISSVVSSSTVLVSSMSPHGINDLSKSSPALVALCHPAKHSVIVVTWALLVQNIMINTSVVVAVDDREGPSVGPPIELLAQGAWTLYLGITHLSEVTEDYLTYVLTVLYLLELLLFLLTVAKLVFKYYAVRKAHQSYAFGRNPRLVFGYMHQQLHLMAREHDAPPPLLVMGEETRQVEKQHHGYVFKLKHASSSLSGAIGLVTIDRVWRQLGSHIMLLLPAPAAQRLKDVFLSFALFKLLRCRFARYELAVYSGSEYNTSNFFWSLLLKDDCEPDRVFAVIADEPDRVFAVIADRCSQPSRRQRPPAYQQLVQLLNDKSNHMVLKNGVKLGQQLVEETTIDGEETAWKLLAGFWSEMILYVTPSDNLKGHKEAIARGGELITLLWALLNHAGIVSRTTTSSDDDTRV